MSSSRSSSSRHTSHEVAPAEAGERLDKWLSNRPGLHSREMARRLIEAGVVKLNATGCSPSTRVNAGDRVEWHVPAATASTLEPEPTALHVLYEDAHLIVLNKPAGMPMHPGPGHARGTLVHHLLAHCGDLSGVGGELRPGIVHRLDKDTSGVVVAAKHDAAHTGLAAQFKAHSIHRAYLALTCGMPPRNAGTIDQPLGRHPVQRQKHSVQAKGRRAVTHWEVLRRWRQFALLRLRLKTGRTHQIRVHLAHEGWPVLGDPVYGERRHRGLSLPPELTEQIERLGRQALHAVELGFVHPLTGAELSFEAELPEDLQELVQALNKMDP